MGVEHVLLGYDHVLFLLVLLLGSSSLMGVVEITTTFTVAHSVTLALASVGWVDLPPELVEPLIALSIAYVAVETIVGGETRRRLVVVFAFGLLHGLGFAGTVDFAADAPGQLASSLLSFNVGSSWVSALARAARLRRGAAPSDACARSDHPPGLGRAGVGLYRSPDAVPRQRRA